jgi:hypothetical protein
MSENKWKQIVGKKISEGAYVSSESLREDYTRAMSKTTFTKTLSENYVEKLAKKMTLMTIAKNAGLVENEEEMKAIWRSRKATRLDKQIEVLEELTERKNTKNNNNCPDGEYCQRTVSEAELGGLLVEGWRVAAVLPSGKIVEPLLLQHLGLVFGGLAAYGLFSGSKLFLETFRTEFLSETFSRLCLKESSARNTGLLAKRFGLKQLESPFDLNFNVKVILHFQCIIQQFLRYLQAFIAKCFGKNVRSFAVGINLHG